jgi:hypothetical protein
MTTIKAEVTVEYLIPRPANYIKTTDGRTVPVGNISEDALREIGKAYTEALIENAEKRGPEPEGTATPRSTEHIDLWP